MSFSVGGIIQFLVQPLAPRIPHPGIQCDMFGPSCRCSICTGLIEWQDDEGDYHTRPREEPAGNSPVSQLGWS